MYAHPIGDDHPFRAIYALAQAQGVDVLSIVDTHDGALIRLFTNSPNICFKLKDDPGSAMDRQRFDYHIHVSVVPAPVPDMLDAIKAPIALETPCP